MGIVSVTWVPLRVTGDTASGVRFSGALVQAW